MREETCERLQNLTRRSQHPLRTMLRQLSSRGGDAPRAREGSTSRLFAEGKSADVRV
jgi:hypothetical protein